MDLPELFIFDEFIKIPKEFYSEATGEPFKKCMVCECDLGETGTPYLIEKAIRRYEKLNATDTIFEYALCFTCQEEVREFWSEESRQKMDAYLAEKTNLTERREKLLQADKLELNPWISHCIFKGTPAEASSEYQIMCQCDGEYMIFAYMPFMISGEAIDEIVQLLSEKTKDELGGFMDKYLGLPPELKSKLTDPSLLIL